MSAAATDSNSPAPHHPPHPHYSRATLLVLVMIAGVSVANIYTNQPLLAAFRASFPESAGMIGAVPAVTQLGYHFDRRLIILLQLVALGVLIAASLALGIVATIALAVLVVMRLPRSKPTSILPYGRLLASMWHLVVESPALREASMTGGALFAAFSIFWSVLTLLLTSKPFHHGYMNAERFPFAKGFSCVLVDRMGCSTIYRA
ncbi:MAG: Uncharacterized MFS-type transporter, partial [uncultured Caballeronia sp.]